MFHLNLMPKDCLKFDSAKHHRCSSPWIWKQILKALKASYEALLPSFFVALQVIGWDKETYSTVRVVQDVHIADDGKLPEYKYKFCSLVATDIRLTFVCRLF